MFIIIKALHYRLTCGVNRISNKYCYLKIFDQQVNLNLSFFQSDSIIKANGKAKFLCNLCTLGYIFKIIQI